MKNKLRKKKSDSAKKTYDKYGKHTARHLRIQEQRVEKGPKKY